MRAVAEIAYTEEEIATLVDERAQRIVDEKLDDYRSELRKQIIYEEHEDEITQMAEDIAEERIEKIKDKIREELLYEMHEDEIQSMADRIAEDRLSKLIVTQERSDFMIDKQAKELEKLYNDSQLLKSLVKKKGADGTRELFSKIEEMKTRIIELEAKNIELRAMQFPDTKSKTPNSTVTAARKSSNEDCGENKS